jgi:LmbE family N-acetylglucosaminyl deacetylase
MTEAPENWTSLKKILVILAHPDDPEFFCGATIARWTSAGHSISYCLLTKGDKGGQDRAFPPQDLAAKRVIEQTAAAAEVGVHQVKFLNYLDGYLVADLGLRRDIVRAIRQEKPDIIVSSDPLNIYSDTGINHPDHRTAGQAVIDAVFPASGNYFFFPELLVEGLEPHSVKEVWLSIPSAATVNLTVDVTAFWDAKIRALRQHVSQIGDPDKLEERMRSRKNPDSPAESPHYEERFHRIVFG